MKKYLLTFILFIFIVNIKAQVYFGARTGATYCFNTYGHVTIHEALWYGGTAPELRWDKELFARYNYKRWSFDFSFSHNKQKLWWIEPIYHT